MCRWIVTIIFVLISGERAVSSSKVRLAAGNSRFDGRIEVYYKGEWGTVCDDYFDDADAQVFCHMLGHDRNGAIAVSDPLYGPGSGNIWMSIVECEGTEASVDECNKTDEYWANSICSHSEDAAIICQPRNNTECSGLADVRNGLYLQSSCNEDMSPVGFNCTLMCDAGFMPSTYENTMCLETGIWDISDAYLTCEDINECGQNNGGCSGKCTNDLGSFRCDCVDGYSLQNDNRTCKDIDECEVDNGGCAHRCINQEGTFSCGCLSGFSLHNDNKSCSDINECDVNNGKCDHLCNNKNGTFSCSCKDGYLLESDMLSCKDIDECVVNNGGCSQRCINFEGNFSCKCEKGYAFKIDTITSLRTCSDVNECETNNGGCQQLCFNENGTFSCSCMPGYSLQSDNATCSDVNECEVNNGGCQQHCSNGNGSFSCSCMPGYSLQSDNATCSDVNECEINNGGCQQHCSNGNGSFSCSCMPGYSLQSDTTTCSDVNECEVNNGGCQQICFNENGTFSCSCMSGYSLQSDNATCSDVNECEINNGGCQQHCSNGNGSFSCSCMPGYSLQSDTTTCSDVNECEVNNGGCQQICFNENGTFSCSCMSGYSLQSDTTTCSDVNECEINNGGCQQHCSNEYGSFSCSCMPGYSLQSDYATCSDVNECEINNGGCQQHCSNGNGSFSCSCMPGYSLQSDNATCSDVNECEVNNGGCQQHCSNENGTFSCSCMSGYSLQSDNATCSDVNECEVNNGGCQQHCSNEYGSFSCSCMSGFSLQSDNATCVVVDECNNGNGGCQQTCTYRLGTFSCGCLHGYSLRSDNISCSDINECDTNNGGCDHLCKNENGTYSCSCKDGYLLQNNAFSCKDLNECLVNNGGCSQRCINSVGTFSCKCEKGYYLEKDAYTCTDENECKTNNGGCEQLCNNEEGSYSCSCEKGFTSSKDNVSCDDINECDTDSGGCQQICTNLEGSFLCSCNIGHILNGDGFTCKNVSETSMSSSLMVLTDARKLKKLQDPATYDAIAQHLNTSIQNFFKKYTNLQFFVVIQQLTKYRNVSDQGDKAVIVVNYTIVYDNETIPPVRDTLIRGTFDLTDWTPLAYNGGSVVAKLVNEPPSISPLSMEISISEDTPTNTVLGDFTVNDPDLDVRGKISVYSDDKPEEILIGPIVNYKVNLTLDGYFDADSKQYSVQKGRVGPVRNFTIVVKDEPGLKIKATVSLIIIDVNDNAPKCDPSEVFVKIKRNKNSGDHIYNLDTVCRDDDYHYNRIEYTIANDTCSAFTIKATASLSLKAKIPDIFSSCLVTVYATDMDNSLFNTTLNVTVRFDECPADTDYLNKAWGIGTPEKYSFGSCPDDYKGTVKRYCSRNGVYHEPVYNCTSSAIAEIFEKILKENASASDVLDDLANVTARANVKNTSLLIGDLEAVSTVLSKITDVIELKPENVEHVADTFIETANNILDESTTTSWTSKMNQTGSGANTVLENLDRFVEKIANVSNTTGELNVAKSNLFLTVGSVTACEDKGIQFPNKEGRGVPDWANETLDTINVPCGGNMTFRSYSGVMYRNLSQILPTTVDDKSITDKKINTPVMSFTYFPEMDVQLDKPVEITFQLYNSSLESPICSFWSKDNSSTGTWSSAGCVLDRFSTDNKTVVCKCNHLTNFAVLMSPSPVVSYHHHVSLSIMSMVGCILSMVCLAITVAVHGFYWRAVKSEISIVNMNLSCVLFMAYLLFLAGVNQTENKGVCTAIAVLLHFAYLVVFFTMLSEGLLLANTVLYPLSNHKPGAPLLIGPYVLAVIIVAISMGAVELDGYGSEKSCWLSTDSGLIWAFLVPVLLIIAVNLAIVALVVKKMLGTSFMSRKTDKEKARACVRSIVILMPIMGVTWVLGIFSVNEDTVVFQYLFALFNSLQGVLIFVFHCVLNRKIQAAFKKSKWLQDVSVSSTQNTKFSRVANERSSAM